MSNIQSAKAMMSNYPNGTKFFMYVLITFICGLVAFMFTAWTGILWIQITAVGSGVTIGGFLGYKICLEEMIKERGNKLSDLGNWTQSKNGKAKFLYALGMIWGFVLLGCFGYVCIRFASSQWIATSTDVSSGGYNSALKEPAVIACIVIFVGSIFLAFIINGLMRIKSWSLIGIVTAILIISIIGSFVFAIIKLSAGSWIETVNGGYNSALKNPLVIACLIIPGVCTLILLVGGAIYSRKK